MKWLARFFRIRIVIDHPPRVPVLGAAFQNELELRRAYEETFFNSDAGLRVLQDILSSNGVFSPSFPDGGNTTVAALRDGYKGCALSILHKAGGSDRRLARAVLLNNLSEARETHETE